MTLKKKFWERKRESERERAHKYLLFVNFNKIKQIISIYFQLIIYFFKLNQVWGTNIIELLHVQKKFKKKNKEHKEQIKLAIYCNNLNEV